MDGLILSRPRPSERLAAGAGIAERSAVHAALHVGLHVAMAAVMAATMLGGHSALRILAGAGALLVLAMAVAPLARRDPAVRGHVLDCFAMALALVAMLASGTMDAASAPHAHGAGIPLQSLPTLALVTAGWLAARLALLLATHARSARRASLVGAALTSAGLALMLAMG